MILDHKFNVIDIICFQPLIIYLFVLSMFCRYFTDVLWMFYGCFMDVLWMFYGCFVVVLYLISMRFIGVM